MHISLFQSTSYPLRAAGNAVIVKPSEVTPLSGELFCRALASSLPEGVLQVVQGDGKIGEQLVSSDDIHMAAAEVKEAADAVLDIQTLSIAKEVALCPNL